MKPIISRLSGHSTLFFFPLLLVFRSKWKNYILLFLGLIILAGCFRSFYKPGTTNSIDSNRIEQLRSSNKYFIIHYRDSVFALSNVTVSNQVLKATLRELDPAHARELYPDQEGNDNVLKKNSRSQVLSEVHLYVNQKKGVSPLPTELQLPLSDIYRMDVYELDQKRTSTSTTWSIVGIAAAVAVVAVVAATAGSSEPDVSSGNEASCGCPQVYIERQGNFEFQNGIFSGAVYSNLERKDYLSLGAIQPGNVSINLRIAGHDNEVQYLNFVQLIGVSHPANSKILADQQGRFFNIQHPVIPENAIADDNKDLKQLLDKADEKSFTFNTESNKEDYSHAYLTFRKPSGKDKAKLIIRAKNSSWSASLYQEYTLLFGEDYTRYRDHQEKTNPRKMEALVLRQGLPVKVYIEKGGQWEYAGYFPLTGTEGYREMLMEINLPEKAEQVRVKLETVYRFWDLDYVAMDFSDEGNLEPFILHPVSADHNGKGDQLSVLKVSDKTYSRLDNNETVNLSFQLPGKAGIQPVDYFLVTSGYYHIQDSYPVKANVKRLRPFKNPAEFDRFSKEKYLEKEQWQTVVKNNKTVLD